MFRQCVPGTLARAGTFHIQSQQCLSNLLLHLPALCCWTVCLVNAGMWHPSWHFLGMAPFKEPHAGSMCGSSVWWCPSLPHCEQAWLSILQVDVYGTWELWCTEVLSSSVLRFVVAVWFGLVLRLVSSRLTLNSGQFTASTSKYWDL